MMCVISTTLLSICDMCSVYAGKTGNHPIIYIPRWNKQLDIIVTHNYSLIVLSSISIILQSSGNLLYNWTLNLAKDHGQY